MTGSGLNGRARTRQSRGAGRSQNLHQCEGSKPNGSEDDLEHAAAKTVRVPLDQNTRVDHRRSSPSARLVTHGRSHTDDPGACVRGRGQRHSVAVVRQSAASSACPLHEASRVAVAAATCRGREPCPRGRGAKDAHCSTAPLPTAPLLHCSTDRREARSVLRDIPSLPASPPGASRQRPVAYGEPVPTRPACPPRQRTAVKGDTDQPTQHAHHDNVPRRAGDIGKTNAHMCLAVPCPRTIGDLVFSGTPAGCTLVTAGPHCTSAQPSHTWPNGN